MSEQNRTDVLINLFPDVKRNIIKNSLEAVKSAVTEIRLYKNSPVLFLTSSGRKFPDIYGRIFSFPVADSFVADISLLKGIIYNATGFAVYAFEKELSEGYITVGGGIRIGICTEKTHGSFDVSKILSLNIRLPFSEEYELPESLNQYVFSGGLLFAGAPGSGKTTMLKACSRKLCDLRSNDFCRVSIIDARGELAAFSGGNGYFAADIVSSENRAEGIQRALRLMNPEYIICDEIGTNEEVLLMLNGLNSGVKFISSVHADSLEELILRKQFKLMFNEKIFSRIVFLSKNSPGKVKAKYEKSEIENEIGKLDYDMYCGDHLRH